jgi:gliding motility-associated-like protein
MTQFECTDSAYLDVHAFSRNHLVLPNIFTPNGDGRNDYFYVIASNKVATVKQFQIYNRWGERVFQKANILPNDYATGWNGTYKGLPAPEGTYVYVIVVQLVTGETETYNGNISILR